VDRAKVDVSSVQPRSSGELPDQVDWSFEAGLLRFQSKWEQAEEIQLQVLGLREKVLGKGHPDTLTSKYDHAEEIGGRV
jgi:hypothetical protein